MMDRRDDEGNEQFRLPDSRLPSRAEASDGGVARLFQPLTHPVWVCQLGGESGEKVLSLLYDDFAEALPEIALRRAESPALAMHIRGDIPVLVIYPPFALALSEGIAAGTKPDEALSAWAASMRSIVEQVRLRRTLVTLIDAEAALAAPERLLPALCARLAFTQADLSGWERTRSQPAPTDAMLNLMAQAMVLRKPELARMVSELDAMGLPLSSEAKTGDELAQQAFAAYGELVGRDHPLARFQDELRRMQDERDEALQQAHTFDSKAAEAIAAAKDLQATLDYYREENELMKEHLRNVNIVMSQTSNQI